MGCDPAPVSNSAFAIYFNPRTRMGCDFSFSHNLGLPPEFQSTHPHGVRPCWAYPLVYRRRFQSTHPGGVRHLRDPPLANIQAISIHAPGWGATTWSLPLWEKIVDFNPRTRMGCDYTIFDRAFRSSLFQSTHPHGVRPRSGGQRLCHILISIHAPAWGATR